MLLIIANTADKLFGATNDDDLKRS